MDIVEITLGGLLLLALLAVIVGGVIGTLLVALFI